MEVIAIGSVWIILFLFGLGLLTAGIVGTILTGKLPRCPKVLRVFSILSLVFGIVLCVLSLLIVLIALIANYA